MTHRLRIGQMYMDIQSIWIHVSAEYQQHLYLCATAQWTLRHTTTMKTNTVFAVSSLNIISKFTPRFFYLKK